MATPPFEFFALVQQFPYPGLFITLVLGSLGLPVPEDVVLLLCGFLITKQLAAPVPAVLVAYSGVIASDFIIYSFGRKYGRFIVTHRRFRKILSPERLAFFEEKFRKSGVFFIFFGRYLWGLRAQVFLTAGILGVSPRKFIMTDACAALITVPLMITLGYMGGRQLESFDSSAFPTEYIGIALAVAAVAVALICRRIMQRKSKTAAKKI